jgi:hypothetical protein
MTAADVTYSPPANSCRPPEGIGVPADVAVAPPIATNAMALVLLNTNMASDAGRTAAALLVVAATVTVAIGSNGWIAPVLMIRPP